MDKENIVYKLTKYYSEIEGNLVIYDTINKSRKHTIMPSPERQR